MSEPTTTERAGIWARVSTGEQETQNQLAALRAWAARRGATITATYLVEESAYTGHHRAKLRQAEADARAGRFDVLLVWALDRLSREGVEATFAHIRRFRERGVRVLSLQEPWTEAAGEVGELLTAIIAWVAQMESQRRSERIKAGLARRKAEGLPVGRQPGAKDRKQRKRSGYYARWEDHREQTG